MMHKVLFLTIATACISSGIVSAATDKVVCYHGIWSTYREGNGKFAVEDIDPTLCTHLIYSFVGILDDGNIKHQESYLDINLGNIKRFNNLKAKNPNLKTLIAIGGWNEGSERFSIVAASATKRANFVKSALNLVQTYELDGFDLDWEYPAQRGGAAADKQNFAILIKELRAAFDKHGLILSAAVAAAAGSVDTSYDVPALSKYLDFINVMAYDLHGSWEGVTGQNAPLYPSSVDVTQNQKQLCVDAAIRGWIQRGADPQKLVLGVGTYGRTFTLTTANNNKVGAPTSGPGSKGPYTKEDGMRGYNEIAELEKAGGWTSVWDDEQKTPYLSKGNEWIGYDNPKSVIIKTEYAKSLNLAGMMIWSVETDDFRGVSGTKFAILRAINQALGVASNENSVPEVQPEAELSEESEVKPEENEEVKPEPEAEAEPETEAKAEADSEPASKSSGDVCSKEGYVRDPENCGTFYYCLPYNGAFTPIELKCNSGLCFDEKSLSCDYPENVQL